MVWTTIPTIQVIRNMSFRGREPNTKSMLIQENIHNAQFTNTGINMNPHTTGRNLERVYEVICNFYSKNNFKILTCWLRQHFSFLSRKFPKLYGSYGSPRGRLGSQTLCPNRVLPWNPRPGGRPGYFMKNELEDRGEGGRVLNQQVSILKLFLE